MVKAKSNSKGVPKPISSKIAKRKAGLDTQEALLGALHRLLRANNGSIPSLQEIAREAKINQALIAYHFGSKDELLFSLLESILGPRKDSIHRLILKDLDPVEKLERYIAGLVNLYFSYPFLNQLTLALVADMESELAQKVSDLFLKPVQKNQEELLNQAVKAGIMEIEDPRFFYFTLLGACERMFSSGYAMKSIFGADNISAKIKNDFISYVQQSLLRGMLKRSVDEK